MPRTRSLVRDPPYQASIVEVWAQSRWPGCEVITTPELTMITLGPGQRLSAAGLKHVCDVAKTRNVMVEAGGGCCQDFRVVIKVMW